MKRKIVCVLLSVALICSTVCTASAAIHYFSLSDNRTSHTRATVSAYGVFKRPATTCSVKIVLQEKYNGSWRTAKGVPVTAVKKNGKNRQSISLTYNFTLKKGKVYRQKTTFTDTSNGTTCKTTYRSGSF